jgi:hypothetical protein
MSSGTQDVGMRLLVLILAIAAILIGGWLVYQRTIASAEARGCSRVAHLCSLEGDEIESCRRVIREVRESAGEEVAERLARCLETSGTCAEAAGCAAGVGVGALSRSLLEFLNGLRRSR